VSGSPANRPIRRKMTYAYDAQARLATVTDKMGNAAGQNPLRHQLHNAYDGATRHQTTITAPDGRGARREHLRQPTPRLPAARRIKRAHETFPASNGPSAI